MTDFFFSIKQKALLKPIQTDKEILDQLLARIEELEERVKYLECEALPNDV